MNQLQLLLVAGLAAVASAASLFGLYWILRQRRRPKTSIPAPKPTGALPYRRVEALLSASERALYRVLRPIADEAGAELFVKVRLDEVVEVRKGAAEYEAHCRQLAGCGIDFMLCDRVKFVPLLALQVEGVAREQRGSEGSERILAQALDAVGIGLLRIPARASYDSDELGALVSERLANAPHSPTAPEAPSAGNGWDEVLGTPERGAEDDEDGDDYPPPSTTGNPMPSWLDTLPGLPGHGPAPELGTAARERTPAPPIAGADRWPAMPPETPAPAIDTPFEAHPWAGSSEDAGRPPAGDLRDAGAGFPSPEDALSPLEGPTPNEDPLPPAGVPALQENALLPADAPSAHEDAFSPASVPALQEDAVWPAAAPALEDRLSAADLPALEQDEEPADVAGAQPAEPPAAQGTAAAGVCPFCGRQLVPMQDVDSGEIVIACSGYPECVYVAPLAP